jgi:hypothetical protein
VRLGFQIQAARVVRKSTATAKSLQRKPPMHCIVQTPLSDSLQLFSVEKTRFVPSCCGEAGQRLLRTDFSI